MRATHLLVPGHVEPDTGEKCCICGRGMGRLQWEREYYGDVLARMGQALWLREYSV